ncbi:MAG: carboxypeptidase-like regulatory domain-containing protein [Gemmatimonas sp.]
MSAQAVRGSVVQLDGATPATGAIVVLEDHAGALVGRTLTDARGEFFVKLADGGVYRARVLRVGYQPTIVPAFSVDNTGATTIRIVVSGAAVVLPTIAVRGQDICRGQRADGAVVAEIWEEARKALLSSELSDGAAPLIAEWIEYERTLDPSGRFVRAQRIRSTRSVTTHAFRSVSWSELADAGYVVDRADGTVFHAPDADVLLSESFASLHCFHVEPPGPGRENQIGVGFRPARERRRISDIEGTFWIDRASNELRALEYRYTNLPAVTERVRPGGTVEFLRLPSGSWLVSRWSIRMPQLMRTAPTTMRRRGVTVTTPTTSIQVVRIVGGEVSRVERADSTLYAGRGATLAVRVAPPDSVVSGADTRITLDGSDYQVHTDAGGRGRLAPILPGEYRLRAQTPLMDSLGVLSEPFDITVRPDDAREHAVPVPGALALLRQLCGESHVGASDAHLRGVIVDSSGMPVADASVRLTWQRQFAVVSDRVLWSDQSMTTQSDSLGTWQLCGVPRDVGMLLRVESTAGQGRLPVRVAPDAFFASAPVVVRPAAERIGDAPLRDAAVSITVSDSASRPLRDATVAVSDADGAVLRMRTDAAGRVFVPRAMPGLLTVDVRKVGFATGLVTAEVDRGDNTIPIVLQRARAPQLSTVRVVGNRPVNARHEDFARRRERGDATASLTAEDIERRAPVSTWQLLTRMPSLLLVDSLGAVYARSSRMSTILCWPRVAIDGLIQPERPNLALLPPPNEIFGIEVFAGPARLPLSFGGEGAERFCGLIAIWTK